MSKQTFQRLALVTIVVLLGTVASQQLMALGSRAIHGHGHDHDQVARFVDVSVIADGHAIRIAEQRALAEEQRELAREERELAREARHLAQEARLLELDHSDFDMDTNIDLDDEFHFEHDISDLSDELRQLKDRIRIEIQ